MLLVLVAEAVVLVRTWHHEWAQESFSVTVVCVCVCVCVLERRETTEFRFSGVEVLSFVVDFVL